MSTMIKQNWFIGALQRTLNFKNTRPKQVRWQPQVGVPYFWIDLVGWGVQQRIPVTIDAVPFYVYTLADLGLVFSDLDSAAAKMNYLRMKAVDDHGEMLVKEMGGCD